MAQLTTVARPYARAAFETAVTAGALKGWSAMLGMLGRLVQDKKVASYLADPARSSGERAQTLIDLCGSELDAKGQNFLMVLAANKRLPLLPEISIIFEEMKAEHEKSVDVEVISAFSMDEAATNKLAAALRQRLQREVKLNTSIDKSLIGGLVVRAGDLVIDGSVRGKLNKLIESMNA
jgi:F-type H+-transporting ATPase subunit delta